MRRLVRSIPVGPTVWIYTLILWLTWSPFILRSGHVDFALLPASTLIEPLVNVLLFVPVGLVLGFTVPSASARTLRTPVVVALGVSILLVEGGQLAVEGRTVSPADALLNLLGGYAAWAAARRLTERGHDTGRSLVWLSSVILAATLGYMLGQSARANGVHRLDEWRPDFRVVVGDEVGGERTYRGEIRDARLCAGQTGQRFCVAGSRADTASRRRLVRTALASQRVTVAAEVRSGTNQQEGPARIVTFSEGISRRNATLGQQGRALLLRLRTPIAGDNGTSVAFKLTDAVSREEWTAVSGRYEEGIVTLRAERDDGETRTREFDTTIWSWAHLVVQDLDSRRPAQRWIAVVLGFLACFLPIGVASGWILAKSPHFGFVAAVGTSICLMLLFMHQLRLSDGLHWPAAACAVALIGFLLGWWDRRRL